MVISKMVSGAGLTSVMSCAAAEVIRDPADWIEGCMRGASDSRLNVESGDGKVNELAVMTSSICWIEDCMMLARAFNSERGSPDTLMGTCQALIIDGTCVTYPEVFWKTDVAD